MKKIWIWIILLAFATGAGLLIFSPRQTQQVDSGLKSLPVTPDQGFAHADGPRVFSFPQDFGPHPDYQTEWWYYTGNLAGPDGRPFGYQLTFFRRALLPEGEEAPRTSDWAVNQVYLAHFTLTDVQGGQFHYYEHFARGAAGLAGAVVDPAFQVWLDNWSVSQVSEGKYQLQAETDGLQIQLTMTDLKGPILEGIDGFSQKGPDPGSASYYFSQTRLESSGMLTLGGQTFQVKGTSWMDHEFSTSALSGDQVGWDWFSLQLSDGSELMVYILRHADGSADSYSQGMLIRPDGSTRWLGPEDYRITSLAHWKSPHSGANYPSDWRVEVPGEQIDLTVKPRLADQELRVSFTYWEGAVAVKGTRAGQAIGGCGYVELTGYAGSMQGQY
jgi:predicted secreted hydrolase